MMMTSKDVSAIGYSLVFIVRPSRFFRHCEDLATKLQKQFCADATKQSMLSRVKWIASLRSQ